MKRRTTLLGALAAPLMLAAGGASLAQAVYPSRTIRLVSPSPPGGAGDVSNRILAKHLSDQMGQPVVIDYRLGGNGVVAAQEALRGDREGYTIFLGTLTALVGNLYLMKSIPYDPSTDFAPVSLIGTIPFILVANMDLPVKSVKELIAYAKANKGKVTFASANTTSQVSASMFASMTGIELQHIPYKSAPASLNDVVSGQVAISFVDIPSARGLIQSGRLRLLGVTADKRINLFPDTPSIAESVPGYEMIGWTAMTVPAGVDPAIVRRLSVETGKVLSKPEVREQMANVGIVAASSTPEELASYLRTERPRWSRRVHDAGIQPE